MSSTPEFQSSLIRERRSAADDARSGAADELHIETTPQHDGSYPAVERRSGSDRREHPTRGWYGLLRRGQRHAGRRASDARAGYIDLYRRRDAALVVGTFLLNLLDAFLTLRWLSLGGIEKNPLMVRMLEGGDLMFLVQKCFVVGVLLLVLIVHRNFALARVGLWGLFCVYAGLLAYHSMLQWGGA